MRACRQASAPSASRARCSPRRASIPADPEPIASRVLLARHGHATSGPDHRWTRDDPLTALGRRQAEELARYVASMPLPPTRLVVSPAVRALQTSAPIADALGLALEQDERLIEFGSGGVSPFTLEEMLEHLPYDDIWHPDDPGWDGETIGAFWRRTAACAADIVGSGGLPLVVSHAGTTTGLLRALLGVGETAPDAFHFVVDNASLTELGLRIDRHGRRRLWLTRLNETGYLSQVTEM